MSNLETKDDITPNDENIETKDDITPIDDDDSDSSDDEYDNDFKKFEQDMSKDVLINYHPETSHISHKQMLILCKVVRNKNGKIIDPLHNSIPYLTRYEKAKIIGVRAKQLNNGADAFIDVPNNMINGLTIADEELKQKKIPFIIRRPMPNGASEYWKVKDLEML
jgi:DNA-directed RNA polymerases I, II, and III subunit RPABC2